MYPFESGVYVNAIACRAQAISNILSERIVPAEAAKVG